MTDRGVMLVTVLALVAASLAAEAQPAGPVRTIGTISHGPPASFEEGLRELGWVEGKNVRFERRMSTDNKKLAHFAAELSRIPVDVIFAGNAASTRAAMEATRVIPIITVSADPVSTGFVASLARPRANVTGLAIMHTELSGKRLEILTQALPTARRIAFLVNPANPSTPAVRRETEARALAIGIKLLLFEASAPEEITKVMAAVAQQRPDALVVQGDPLFGVTRQQLLEAVARHRVPAMWELRGFVEAGGLMSYGADPSELYRRAATYVDRILRGTKPGDLPVEQATKFELVVNLKAAKALGLTIPQSVLARADQVVEK
jgi:putative ABC transport system substrate-binding protein